MSKRLQVVVADDELARFEDVARVKGLTLSEWVRQSLRTAERQVSPGDVERKLMALRRAAECNFDPEVDIEQMLSEIESGYLVNLPPAP